MSLFKDMYNDPNNLNSSEKIHKSFDDAFQGVRTYWGTVQNGGYDDIGIVMSISDFGEVTKKFNETLDQYANSIGVTRLSLYFFECLSFLKKREQELFREKFRLMLIHAPILLLPLWYYQREEGCPDRCVRMFKRKNKQYRRLISYLLEDKEAIYLLGISGNTSNALYDTIHGERGGSKRIRIIGGTPTSGDHGKEVTKHVLAKTGWQCVPLGKKGFPDPKEKTTFMVPARLWFWDGFVVRKGIKKIIDDNNLRNYGKITMSLGPFKCFYHDRYSGAQDSLTDLLDHQLKDRVADRYEVLPFSYVDCIMVT